MANTSNWLSKETFKFYNALKGSFGNKLHGRSSSDSKESPLNYEVLQYNQSHIEEEE